MSLQGVELVAVSIMVLAVLAMVIGAAFVLRKRRLALRRFSASLGQERLQSGRTYEAEVDGCRYEYAYRAGSRNRPASFEIRIECASPGDFEVRPERRLDRLFKRLGIAAELQTGDGPFDEDFYIHTNSVGFCRRLFGDADVRETVRRISALGYGTLRHDAERLEAVCSPFTADASRPVNFVEGAVRQLAVLAARVPQEAYEPRTLGMPSWKLARGTVFTIAGLSVVAGMGTFVWGRSAYPPLDQLEAMLFSLRYSGAALLAFLVLAAVLLRGRSGSHKELLLSGGIVLFGIPLTGVGGLFVLNGYGDDSPPVRHEMRVLDKHSSRHRSSTTYYVHLRSWRPGHDEERLSVSPGTYRGVRAGRSVLRVTTRAGRYGLEWVDDYRIVE
ncbi:MAG: hypothetical protein GWN84_09880 [Gammaproteobacteria bacterium]|nr:hypothetical protein [Gammaproteobacteria bacterium]NIR83172.1 hypothetical protein [Gammaproteobacteria bacterium]NIR90980.1 hypothetical protein [Gammaproteobacteria bacterium]NIU04337.1 hypothetical protein [Gammaproteobacteria bacterium]NIV52560.1 hypothetical protein [Gammaproteobacteria bacterium]